MGRINWLEKLKWTEEHIEDLRYTGYSYIKQGKYDIALPFFEALTVLDPASAYDAQTLGAIYLQLNQPNKAMIQFNRALKIDSGHPSTLLNVSKAFFMVGKKDEGLKIAHILKNNSDKAVANIAKALILAYE
jgi:tetratricopeptide (TPR) repeat protein